MEVKTYTIYINGKKLVKLRNKKLMMQTIKSAEAQGYKVTIKESYEEI